MRCAISALIMATVAAANVSAGNLVQNPGFDGDITDWFLHSDPNMEVEYSTEDASGNPASGSASVTNHHPEAATVKGLSQCISVVEGFEYRIGAEIMVPSGQGIAGFGGVTVYWYGDPGCSSYITGLLVNSDVTGAWTSVVDYRTAPSGAQSARVYVTVHKADVGGSLNALADDVGFEPVLFHSGFESGDFSGWSATIP